MADNAPVSIFTRQLASQYRTFSQHAEFGAADHFYKLQALAWSAYGSETGARKLACFVLSTMFGRLASEAESGPVTSDGAREAFKLLDQCIKVCVDELASPRAGVGTNIVDALTALLAAYDQVKLSAG